MLSLAMQDPPRRLSTRGVVSLEWNRNNNVDQPFASHCSPFITTLASQPPTAASSQQQSRPSGPPPRPLFMTEPADQLQALAHSLAVPMQKLAGTWCDAEYLVERLASHRACALASEQFLTDAALGGRPFARRRAMLAEIVASVGRTTPDQLCDAARAVIDELSAPLKALPNGASSSFPAAS